MWSNLRSDVAVALRTMLRQPLFSLVIIATLAIGIGANTAMFALVHATLLKPLPYKDPGRLILARRTLPGRLVMWNSAPDYYDYREQATGFEALAAAGPQAFNVTVTGGERPERVATMQVSFDLLQTLGVAPVAGRLFSPAEGRADSPYVAVIGARLAEQRFGSARAAVGRTLAASRLTRANVPLTIIGVLPSKFRFLADAEMWVPMRRGEGDGPETRRFHNWVLVGRLKPGVTIAAVQAQVDVIARRLQQQYPETNKVKGLRLDLLQAGLMQSRTPRMLMLLGAVALVLLIACTNVAGMLLARGVARRSELAVRAALGASRWRVAAQLLTETVVLSVAGGCAGLILAVWLCRFLPAAAGLDPADVTAGLDGQVLLFAMLASVATGVVCGAVPALRAPSRTLTQDLAPGARATDSRGGSRLRSALVVAQVALSLLLLVGAGLLVRSLAALMTTDLRFDTENLATTAIDIPYEKVEQRLAFQETLRDGLSAIPGVTAVAFTSHTPILEAYGDPPMYPADRPPTDSSQERTALARWVLPGFFKTLGIRQVSGRDIAPSDRRGTPLVMVVNQAFTREFFPGENPLGKRMVLPGADEPMVCEIVGVVDDARIEGVDETPYQAAYLAASQRPLRSAKVLLRSTLPPAALTEAVRKVVTRLNPDIPVDPLVRVEDLLVESLGAARVIAFTLTSFSIIALLLAALGLYGILTHQVAQRMHELGVRLALGSGSGRIVRAVLARSALMVGPGLAIGLLAAFAARSLVAPFLYGVPPTDPATWAGVTAGLALVALAASAWPAWRASRIDPVRALRGE